MKLRTLAIIPALALITGCSTTNQSTALEKVILGCDAFNRSFDSNDYKMPKDAMRYFAEAARLDSGYIPLAKDANLLIFDPDTNFIGVDYSTLRVEAYATVNGVCTE